MQQQTITSLPPLPHFTSDSIQERFERFHNQNPDIYERLKYKSLRLKLNGHTWYSIDALLHSLRVEMDLSGVKQEGGYRLNDHFTSRYSRLLMENEPALRGFFKTRLLRSEIN